VGAVVLAIATMAAIVFALLNFDQRARFESPDDGVSWRDTTRGVEALQVSANSPGQKAGVRVGDQLVEINATPVASALQVTKKLWRAGLWTQVRYKLSRNGEEFETPLVTAPAEKPESIENYLRFAGLLYLFIDSSFFGSGGTRRVQFIFMFFAWCRLFLLVPLQRKTGSVRLRSILREYSGDPAGARAAFAFRSGFSRSWARVA